MSRPRPSCAAAPEAGGPGEHADHSGHEGTGGQQGQRGPGRATVRLGHQRAGPEDHRRQEQREDDNRNQQPALARADGEGGRAFLAYDNYKVLMHWNRSYYFVTSVGYLADLITAAE